MAEIREQIIAALRRLLAVKTRKPGTLVRLPQQTLITICECAKDVIQNEPALAKIHPPINIVGDIHGQYYDLLRIFGECGAPPDHAYLFLGDYVDRGSQSIETVALLLSYKILFPYRVLLLRGNHECAEVNEVHGFKAECVARYSARLWAMFNEVFAVMPVAASVGGKIFAAHGGISPDIESVEFFQSLERPIRTVVGPAFDLLWSDPDPLGEGWRPNPRGNSQVFGKREAHKFLDALKFEILVRSHQRVSDGFDFPFEGDQSVVTIFSAPSLGVEGECAGAVLVVSKEFACSFVMIRPMERRMPKSLSPIEEILAMKYSPSKNRSIKRSI
jgi:serine/threonine-protein phosphatase PP1 catalytic subunit